MCDYFVNLHEQHETHSYVVWNTTQLHKWSREEIGSKAEQQRPIQIISTYMLTPKLYPSPCAFSSVHPWLTFGLRPLLPLTFLKGLMDFLLLELSSGFSETGAWLSTFTLPPLFLERSSGWILGRTPPFDMVTPRKSWQKKYKQSLKLFNYTAYNTLRIHYSNHNFH